MDTVTDAIDDSVQRNTPLEPSAKKPPRKPRPSEIAAKLAKAEAKKGYVYAPESATHSKYRFNSSGHSGGSAAKPKPKSKAKVKKPIAKTRPKAKKPKIAHPRPPRRKAVRKGRPLVRTCRMDIRLAPKELAKLKRIAKAKDISATAMLVRLIEKAA